MASHFKDNTGATDLDALDGTAAGLHADDHPAEVMGQHPRTAAGAAGDPADGDVLPDSGSSETGDADGTDDAVVADASDGNSGDNGDNGDGVSTAYGDNDIADSTDSADGADGMDNADIVDGADSVDIAENAGAANNADAGTANNADNVDGANIADGADVADNADDGDDGNDGIDGGDRDSAVSAQGGDDGCGSDDARNGNGCDGSGDDDGDASGTDGNGADDGDGGNDDDGSINGADAGADGHDADADDDHDAVADDDAPADSLYDKLSAAVSLMFSGKITDPKLSGGFQLALMVVLVAVTATAAWMLPAQVVKGAGIMQDSAMRGEIQQVEEERIGKDEAESDDAVPIGENPPSVYPFEGAGEYGIDAVSVADMEAEEEALDTVAVPYVMEVGSGSRKCKALLSNHAGSSETVRFIISMEDADGKYVKLYESGPVAPGEWIEQIELLEDLDDGIHDATVRVEPYSLREDALSDSGAGRISTFDNNMLIDTMIAVGDKASSEAKERAVEEISKLKGGTAE
jgi:hypothetical protein